MVVPCSVAARVSFESWSLSFVKLNDHMLNSRPDRLIELSRTADEVAYLAGLARQGTALEREAIGKTIVGTTGLWIGGDAPSNELERSLSASVTQSEKADLGGREPRAYSVWSATDGRHIGLTDETLGSQFRSVALSLSCRHFGVSDALIRGDS